MRETLDFFLNDQGTTYQLRVEMREAGIVFSLSVSNATGSIFASGEALERDGDLESYDDGDGNSYIVSLYRHRSPECKLTIALSLESNDFAWITKAESADQTKDLQFASDLPLLRVWG